MKELMRRGIGFGGKGRKDKDARNQSK